MALPLGYLAISLRLQKGWVKDKGPGSGERLNNGEHFLLTHDLFLDPAPAPGGSQLSVYVYFQWNMTPLLASAGSSMHRWYVKTQADSLKNP